MDKQLHLIVGIDIGKRYHQATIIDDSGQILGGSIRFPNTTVGGELLLKRITSVNPEGLLLLFGLEATGHRYSKSPAGAHPCAPAGRLKRRFRRITGSTSPMSR